VPLNPSIERAAFGSLSSQTVSLKKHTTTRLQMPLSKDISAPSHFDFIIGDWHVRHRRLNSRLSGCTEWTVFEGLSCTRQILGGFGNVEDNVLRFPEGEVRAAAFRSFDRSTRKWSIWWLDGRNPHQLDAPVVGEFTGTKGVFFADDSLRGQPIKVRFIWHTNPGSNPTWEQAFSPDAGETWETNWTMEFRLDSSIEPRNSGLRFAGPYWLASTQFKRWTPSIFRWLFAYPVSRSFCFPFMLRLWRFSGWVVSGQRCHSGRGIVR